MKKIDPYDRSIRLVEQLIATSPDPSITAMALRLQSKLMLPMAKVLAQVPGNSVTEKAKLLEITRQTWYNWIKGDGRPNISKARQLERITGYTVSQIRGGEGK